MEASGSSRADGGFAGSHRETFGAAESDGGAALILTRPAAIGAGQKGIRRIKPRSTAHHAVAAFTRTLRILIRRRFVIGAAIPIGGPLPHIADHVVQAEIILLFRADVLGPVIETENR